MPARLDSITERDDLPAALFPGAVIVELGVAAGKFSDMLLSYDHIEKVYSVDRWAGDRKHDDAEYLKAKDLLKKYGERSEILRMDFEEAASRFDDESVDMVYVDGYAHEGDKLLATMRRWWPKVVRNGILAGHDYDKRWPLVVESVHSFRADINRPLMVFGRKGGPNSGVHPSWAFQKG